MSEFESFDRFLASSEEGPLWNEDGQDHAATILTQFTEEDWATLQNTWRDKCENWQSLLADLLSLSDAFQLASCLLLDMVTSRYERVGLNALESLRCLEPIDRTIVVSFDQRDLIETKLKRDPDTLNELSARLEVRFN